MTLDEAIDRNVELRGELLREGRLEKVEGVQLDIEALKRFLAIRVDLDPDEYWLLPGETEE